MAGTLLTVQCEGHAQRAIETLRAVGVFGHRDGCTALPENEDDDPSRSLNTSIIVYNNVHFISV